MENINITGSTKLTGLLGSPVAHSKSPAMHNESFRLLGLDYVYLCFDVDENNMESAVEGLRTLGVAGFNCTMPDKIKMWELCDDLSLAANLASNSKNSCLTLINDCSIVLYASI